MNMKKVRLGRLFFVHRYSKVGKKRIFAGEKKDKND